MNTRTRLRLALAGCVTICAILAAVTLAARSRGAALTAEVAALQDAHRTAAPVSATTLQPAGTASRPQTSEDAATVAELAERAALLEAARRVPEVARRELALRAIQQIKAQHEFAPPTPRPLPPPMPKNSAFFHALLDDPEYLKLVGQRWQVSQGQQRDSRLANTGVPEALRQQVMQVELDSYVSTLDLQRYIDSSEEERRAAVQTRAEVQRENDARIRQLLGDEAYASYRQPQTSAATPPDYLDSSLEPLSTRLSYSDFPLDAGTRSRLNEILTSLAPSSGAAYSLPRSSPDFVERARGVLQPAQIAALQQIQAEYQAARDRSKLPKSSELPRTTRRLRMEGK